MNFSRLCPLILLAAAWLSGAVRYGTIWKLVLKDGSVVACDAPPLVIDGAWMFRGIDGQDGSIPAAQVDLDKTAAANKVEARPKWREIGHSVQMLGPKIDRSEPPAPRASRAVSGASAGVLTLDDADFDQEVLNSRVPVLVDFFATWCGPCRMVAPTVDAIASQYAGRVKVARIDVDESRATVARCGVHAFPTLMLFKNGAAVGRIVGVASQGELAQMLDSHL